MKNCQNVQMIPTESDLVVYERGNNIESYTPPG